MIINNELSEQEITLLESLIGKEAKGYICDEFLYNRVAYMGAWVVTEDKTVEINIQLRSQEYFGTIEDVACLSCKVADDGISSYTKSRKLVESPINKEIEDILLVYDSETLVLECGNEFTWRYLDSIVFSFNGTELALEMASCFSEDLEVNCTKDATSKITQLEDKIADFEKCQVGGATREIYSLKQKKQISKESIDFN